VEGNIWIDPGGLAGWDGNRGQIFAFDLGRNMFLYCYSGNWAANMARALRIQWPDAWRHDTSWGNAGEFDGSGGRKSATPCI
jgi:hypothetical protein